MSKAAVALEIYNELVAEAVPDLRKQFISRCKSDLAMSDAGAATYFQTTKRKAEGQPLKQYGKAGKAAEARRASSPINEDPWSVIRVVDDKVVDCGVFIGEQAARDTYEKLSEANKDVSEVVQGSVAVGSDYVLGA